MGTRIDIVTLPYCSLLNESTCNINNGAFPVAYDLHFEAKTAKRHLTGQTCLTQHTYPQLQQDSSLHTHTSFKDPHRKCDSAAPRNNLQFTERFCVCIVLGGGKHIITRSILDLCKRQLNWRLPAAFWNFPSWLYEDCSVIGTNCAG